MVFGRGKGVVDTVNAAGHMILKHLVEGGRRPDQQRTWHIWDHIMTPMRSIHRGPLRECPEGQGTLPPLLHSTDLTETAT